MLLFKPLSGTDPRRVAVSNAMDSGSFHTPERGMSEM